LLQSSARRLLFDLASDLRHDGLRLRQTGRVGGYGFRRLH
jgi:hypothetical protein